jgi:thiol-disulfide isomerase/thioredoxin
MKGRLLPVVLAASLAGSFVSAGRESVEVRICSSLEEAAPAGGGPVLLVFFSTDCPVCYDDLFESRYLLDEGEWPVAVVGVVSGPRQDLRTFLEKYRWTLPVVLDRRKVLFRKFKVDAVPFKALLVGAEAVYRDDPYRAPEGRREELKRCLTRLFSR